MYGNRLVSEKSRGYYYILFTPKEATRSSLVLLSHRRTITINMITVTIYHYTTTSATEYYYYDYHYTTTIINY